MKKLFFALFASSSLLAQAQLSPAITSWVINPDTTLAANRGYGNIPSNVLKVQYSANYVYVSADCIPGYSIGPWTGNPNTPANQNFVYKIPLAPQKNTGTATTVGLGHIGIWTNGVSIFNVSDAMSYNNAGVWNRNAYYWEGVGFDGCLGHPQQQGEYHHHVSPKCLYNQTDSTHHSPIIGYSFDGFPVYGAYAYTDTNGTGAIKRMKSSYILTPATTRTNGPVVNAQYPLGCFIEDFTYTAGSGDLDASNGRWCKTPEYPNGTYAYFVTIDASLTPTFPYTYYGHYYGVVPAGSTGPQSGHVTITESTTAYTVTTGVSDVHEAISCDIMPNPTQDYVYIYMGNNSPTNVTGKLYNTACQLLQTIDFMQPSIAYSLDLTKYPTGVYMLHLSDGKSEVVKRIVKEN